MNLKLKLPGRSTASGVVPKRNYGGLIRKLRKYALYGAGFFLVFVVFAWLNLPTKAIAWRIGHEAKKQGMMVTVEDVSISPFGSVTLHEVVWNFKPEHPEQNPVPFVVEEFEVDISLLSLLIGNYDVDATAILDEGTITANYFQGSDESTMTLSIEELPLYSVPKLQQSVNAPTRGLFGLEVDLEMPENKFENAVGTISLTCAECSVGDGVTKMFVPGSRGMLAEGVTMPELNLGSIAGVLHVDQGVAVMEEFEAKSEHITLRAGGKIEMADPFQKSRLELLIKLFVAEALLEGSDQLRLLVGTSSKSAQMDPPDEGWLGFKLRGSVGRPKFSGIKSKSKEERMRDAREKRRQRSADRSKKKRERAKAREEKKEATAKAAEEGAFVPDPNKDKDEEEAATAKAAVNFEPTTAAPAGDEEPESADEGGEGGAGEEEEEAAEEENGESGAGTEGGEAAEEPQIIQ